MSVLIIFHDRIISLKEEVWVLKTSLTRPLVVEVAVPSHESVRSCNFVLGYRFCPFLRFANWILELFLQCGIFSSPFIHKNCKLCCWCLILLYLLFVNMVVSIGIDRHLQTFISYIHRNPR